MHGDAGYEGVGKREGNRDADVHWRVAMNPEAQVARQERPGGGGGEAQSVGLGEGGAPVPVREAALRVREGALPGAGEEHERIALLLGFANLLIAGIPRQPAEPRNPPGHSSRPHRRRRT